MNLPPGLAVSLDFLTPEEEQTILASIPQNPKADTQGRRNSVRRYWQGTFEVPDPLIQLRDRLIREGHLPAPVTRITVNEYYPGDALGAHVDSPEQGKDIAVVSLLSPATMVFSRQDHPDCTLILPPRSVVFMRGESRYQWTHRVLPLAALRYSVAFHGTPMI